MNATPNRPDGPRGDKLTAFLETEYRVWPVADTVTVKIGQTAPGLDWRLRHRPWAIVTPFNPGGLPVDREANLAALTAMCVRLNRDHGLELHPARNVDPSGRWPDESSILVVQPPAAVIHQIAREFGQLGAVTGGPGQPAKLWLYGTAWPSQLPEHVHAIDRELDAPEAGR